MVAIMAAGEIVLSGRTEEIRAGGSLTEAFIRVAGPADLDAVEMSWLR
ncbi:hypothetical protein GCM10009790_39200 [Georgenia ruanii]